ncbi:DUF2671 domain-containing protein [Wolbachia endosymbiont of Pentidionis agamae]|uniref:DUF2671 domain-containing protein n=1 Tax=Wolbachia endosymbiont of Pentidionis agamae TaxID=3110435 RepID=UPI002FD08874
MSYIGGEVVDSKVSKRTKDSGDALLTDPAYREKYKERLFEAQKKSMDMVQFFDGTIILIENKIAMYYYTWHNKKREFERKKQQVIMKNQFDNKKS